MSADASTASSSHTGTASSVGTATASGATTLSTYSSTERERELINANLPSDVDIFGEKWSATWIDGMKCAAVYRAIAGEAGKEEAKKLYDQLEWSDIPRDFIVDSDKWSNEQLEVRMLEYGHVVFTKLKRDTNKVNKEAITEKLSQDYKNRLYNLRDMVVGLGKPRGSNVFGLRFNGRFTTYLYNGKKIQSIEDFKDAIINEPYDNSMREMIHYVQNQMWGRGNTYALQIEAKIMQLLKLRYVDEYCDLTKDKYPKKIHPGGCIKTMLVRLKQSSMVNAIRRLVKNQHCETLYHRNVKISSYVPCIIKVTKKSHGFNGYLGLCVGHPDLEKELAKQGKIKAEQVQQQQAPEKEAPVATQKPTDMRAWFEEVMAGGRVNTPAELMEVLHTEDGSGRPSIVVTDGGSKSSLSHLTPADDDSDATVQPAVPARAVREKLIAHQQKTAQPPGGRRIMTQSIGSARSRTEVTRPKQVKSVPKKANPKSKKKAAKNSKKTSKKKPTSKPMVAEDFLKRLDDESDSDDEVMNQIPTPPKSSPRKKRTCEQIEKELIKKPKCVCDHTAKNPFLSGYSSLNQGYYTESYLKKKADAGIAYPTSCAHCKAAFVTGRGATEKDYKVTTTKVVRCCPNALVTTDKCEFGLCDSCYLDLVVEAEQELQKKTAKDPRASSRGLVKNKRAKRTAVTK